MGSAVRIRRRPKFKTIYGKEIEDLVYGQGLFLCPDSTFISKVDVLWEELLKIFYSGRKKKTPYWYYRLKGWKSFKSTGQKSKATAKRVALEAWKALQENNVVQQNIIFEKFVNNFFQWDYLWCKRQYAKGRL